MTAQVILDNKEWCDQAHELALDFMKLAEKHAAAGDWSMFAAQLRNAARYATRAAFQHLGNIEDKS